MTDGTKPHPHGNAGGECLAIKSFQSALERIAIVPAQLFGAPPRDQEREGVETKLTIGKNTVEHPIELDTPILLSGLTETYSRLGHRQALIAGAAGAGTFVDLGWLGFLADEKELAERSGAGIGLELTSARIGASIPMLNVCDAVILSLAHSGTGSINAKGSSVIIPGDIAPELIEILGLEPDNKLLGPVRYLDMDTPRDLNKLVQLIREITVYQVPVIVKIGPAKVYNDIRIAVNARPDGIVLDCMQWDPAGHMQRDRHPITDASTGLPALGVLAPMAQALKDGKAEKADVKLIFSGDIFSGSDIFKVMAFGASGVMLASAPLLASGMISKEKQSAGSKTSKRMDFSPTTAGKKISSNLNTMLDELKAVMAWTGHEDIGSITTDDLRALSYNTAAITGLKLIGYDKILTMWEH
jgi:glutamate synthase domain-containing protein 2